MTQQLSNEGANSFDQPRFVCGYPKTGRTWLRYMLANALSESYSLDVAVDLNNVYSLVPNDSIAQIEGQPDFAYAGRIPHIQMSHKPHEQAFEEGYKVFLTRDPRDIMVSHWLHDTNHVHLFDGAVSDYIRHPRGIVAFTNHLESWAPHLKPEEVIPYETMRSEPVNALQKIFSILRISVSEVAIVHAVEAGEIEKMRQIEINGGLAGQTYDRTNPEALRVRKGKIGGFVDYLAPSDLAYIASALDDMSPRAKEIISQTAYSA